MSLSSNYPNINPSLNLDFANTKQLDPRITFTRNSIATYYDGVTTSMAEQNLLVYSQDFTNAAWVKTGITGSVTATANVYTAPDGTTTASRLVLGSTGVNIMRQLPAAISVSGGIYACSVWLEVKTGSVTDITFDTGNGVELSVFSQLLAGQMIRCTAITTRGSGGAWFDIQITGTTGAEIAIWGAQVEQRSSVTAYTPTTTQAITNYMPVLQTAAANVARFDHNPTTGESLGLLIEESRTNLFTNSEFASGVPAGVGLISATTMFGPTGVNVNAVAFGYDGVTDSYIYKGSVTASTQYAISVYVKMTDGGAPSFGSASSQSGLVDFALVVGGALGAPNSFTVTNVGNGLYRVSGVITSGANLSNNGVIKYATNSNRTFKVTAWQIEAGTFPTSYIATQPTSVTRSADAASMTGTNFTSWYNASAGVLFAEASQPTLFLASRSVASLANSTSRLTLYRQASGNVNGYVDKNSSGSVTAITGIMATANLPWKQAIAYQSTTINYASGGQYSGTTATSLFPPDSLTYLVIGGANLGPSESTGGHIRKIAYYPQRLTDAQLQVLTS